jgi:zinc/manganese transport system substrate-binding protein
MKTSPRRLARLLTALLLGLLVGAPGAARAGLEIVATIPDLAALAKAVGGERVQVSALAAAGEDPHYVDPRPAFLPRLARAQAVVLVGLELEVGWLPPLLVNARNPAIVPGGRGYLDTSTCVARKLQVPTTRVDRAMGDVHPGGNPHFHNAPGPMAEVALCLGDRFAALDPSDAAGHRSRAAAFAASLRALEREVVARFEALAPARRKVVVFHDSLRYLGAWLRLEQVATIEEKPGIRPSPAQVARVLGAMRASNLRVILQEAWHADGVGRMLATQAPGKLVKLTGGTSVLTGPGLLAYLRALAETIHAAL